MSSGGKGGSNTVNEYHGTFAGALGEGPAWSLEWIICGGKTVWSGGLTKPAGADYSDLDLVGVGRARFYWGTETQLPDEVLNSYESHPAYRGWVYIVLIDCSTGGNGETSLPTFEVGWRRLPNQLIVSGSAAAFDGACTSNAIAVGAELLTSWSWGGLPASRINEASFQAVADSLQAETIEGTNRIRTAVAPLWNEQTDLKAALADLSSVAGVWVRDGVDGRIEAGRWRRDGSVTGVAQLTLHDVDSARFSTEKADELPNSFTVEFRDATKHHKTNSVTVNNNASIRSTGIIRRQTASRSLLIWSDQAVSHGSDLTRESAAPKTTLTLALRRSKAINPDGTAIRPGDYFTFPVEQQGDAPDTRLFRCTRREFDPTGPITLTGEMELNGSAPSVDPALVNPDVAEVTPPIAYARVVPLPFGEGVAALAARPGDMVYSFDLQYCATRDGDYASIGSKNSFALPLSLAAALGAGAGTIRVSLVSGANGIDARRDKALLLDYNGGAGEANADRLLMLVVKKDGSGAAESWEWLSVSGPPTAVGVNTYDVPVLRGRMRTRAGNFTAGAFPDAWANFEVWCVDSTSLVTLDHPDFRLPNLTHAPSFFHFVPLGRAGTYDPDQAWSERERRVAELAPLQEFYQQQSGGAYCPEIAVVMPARDRPTDIVMVSAPGDMQDVAPIYYPPEQTPSNPNAGKKQQAGKLKWAPPAFVGIAFYELVPSRGPLLEYIQDPTGNEPIGVPTHRTKGSECVFIVTRSMAYSSVVWWVRAVYADGTVSPWGGPVDESMTDDYGTKDMAEQPSSNISVTGGIATGMSLISAEIVVETSSRRYKRNIRRINDAMVIVKRLRGVRYDPRKGGKRGRVGMIAEETFNVLPAMVALDKQRRPDGIDYAPIVGVLVEALKQQDREWRAKVRSLERRLSKLERN